jgi:hypothetical protein
LQNSTISFFVEKHKLFASSIFFVSNFLHFHWFVTNSQTRFSNISSLSSEILSLFCWCMSLDTIRFCDLLDFEWFLFLKIISIFSRLSFQIASLIIFQRIAFDSHFFSYELSLCRWHKRIKSINHWRINNLLLKSTADLNFSESWSDFDIKESRLALTRIKLYSTFNNNRIEKIRWMIHCITSHQFHYWWRRWRRRIVKFSNQRQSRWSSKHERLCSQRDRINVLIRRLKIIFDTQSCLEFFQIIVNIEFVFKHSDKRDTRLIRFFHSWKDVFFFSIRKILSAQSSEILEKIDISTFVFNIVIQRANRLYAVSKFAIFSDSNVSNRLKMLHEMILTSQSRLMQSNMFSKSDIHNHRICKHYRRLLTLFRLDRRLRLRFVLDTRI